MPISLHDKNDIERFLRRNVYLHIYGIGDLDDFFWPYTIWFGAGTETDLDAVALLYLGQSLPTLLALSEQPDRMRTLLESLDDVLPSRLYAHLSPGLESVLGGSYDVEPHGEHYKMALQRRAGVTEVDCAAVASLGPPDLDEVRAFYQQGYPGNWFDPRMLETGQYFGIRQSGRLASVAGVHVYSRKYRVAALGNVATLPAYRGQGYATKVTARVCQSLSRDVEHIGLNVKADNRAAISCYRRLGFEVVASYGEFMLRRE